MGMITLNESKMIMGTNLKIVNKGGNIYVAIMKICIRKNWIDYLKSKNFWKGQHIVH